MTQLRLKGTQGYFAMWLDNWWRRHESHYSCEEEDGTRFTISGLNSLPYRPDGETQLCFFGHFDTPAAPWPPDWYDKVLVALDTFPLPANHIRVNMWSRGRQPAVFCGELLACIAEDFECWDQLLTEGQLAEALNAKAVGAKRGPTEKTIRRADKFKELKDKHPNWGRDTVALEASEDPQVGPVTSETVRYVYKQMGWEWERADRVR